MNISLSWVHFPSTLLIAGNRYQFVTIFASNVKANITVFTRKVLGTHAPELGIEAGPQTRRFRE